MWPVIPGSFTVAVIGVLLVLVVFAMRVVQPEWWSSRLGRTLVLIAFGGMLVGIALWGTGKSVASVRLIYAGAGIAYAGVLVVLPAAMVMPVAALLDRVLLRTTRRRSVAVQDDGTLASESEKISRRAVIRFGSASLPATAAFGGASGLVAAREAPTMPHVRMRWPGLHPDLDGFRILHLSDLHLGASKSPEDLERAPRDATANARPDLIVLTGDLADYPPFITKALQMVANVNARHGAFASLGNHEYIHDIRVTRPLYEKGPVPLLCGSGRTIQVGRATLYIGGADDPVHMHGDIPALLTPTIEAAAAQAPPHADFRLLLCHRPEGHGPAAASGFDLTLSGHTHGGQIGLFGRSLLEQVMPGIGWWGAYAKKRPLEIARGRERGSTPGPSGPSRLYTTSGFGHWFPFRLGCPTEMPLIVLESDRRTASPDRA